MGTISPYETVNGRRYRVRYRKPDHTETQKRGFRTMREAKLYLSMVTVSKSKGDYIDPTASRVPVQMFADSWLRSKHPPMSKPSYYVTLEQAWKNHVAPVWAHREISSIRRSEVQDWVSELATQKSRTVVLRALGVLAGILDVAIDDRRLTNNPARHIRNLPRNGPGRRRVYLSHDQVATLAACSAHPTMVLTLAYTGLRWGEATGLRVRSVNRLRRRFVIEENAVMIAYEIHVGTPKTHEKRSVPYPQRLASMIEQACAGKGPEGLLFGDGVNHMRNSGSQGWFANAVKRAQAVDPSIPRLTPHDLRHTAASLAISSGANVKAVQRMLGHASAAMTLDTYADLFDDDLDAVAARLNDAMPLVALPAGPQARYARPQRL
ncbi:site-specific integrase [Microbacterium lacus]|uniref:tyrosine-type recombinase/integrase n=1 Tax=Microbacterium lacus TaxID=415217 RepID=UPI00384AEB5C